MRETSRGKSEDEDRPALHGRRASAVESRRVDGADNEAYLQIKSVSKTFGRRGSSQDEQTRALSDVSISIRRKEFVSIIGPSGCGKTTLLRLIAGLEVPDSGSVVIGGRPVEKPSPERAVVFQQPALLPWATIIDNVCLGLRFQKVPKRERGERGMSALETVGLGGFENHLPHELSGGMQQRAALARAFVSQPSVLLMDEPFASLDEITRRRLHRELLSLWGRERRTGVFITHNVPEAILLADRVVVMSPRPGQVIEIFDVDLPQPRTVEQEASPKFQRIKDDVWRRVEEWSE